MNTPGPRITATTTDIWVDFWNDTFLPWAEGGSGGGANGLAAFLGNGRMISAALLPNDGDNYLPPSPSLAVQLPENTRWVQDGALITLESDTVIAGVPANFAGWIALHVAFDEEAQADIWSLSTHVARPVPGFGVLGHVTADADSVTTIDSSEVQSDVIPTMPLLMQRHQSTEARLAQLEGSTGEGTGTGTSGGFVYAGSAPWLPAPGDDRATSVVIQAQRDDDAATMRQAVADLEARLRDYIENGTDLREELVMQTSNEWQIEALIRLLSKLTEVNTHAPEWLEVAMVKFGTFGHAPDGAPPPAIGINDTPNELLFTTLQIDGEGASP